MKTMKMLSLSKKKLSTTGKIWVTQAKENNIKYMDDIILKINIKYRERE